MAPYPSSAMLHTLFHHHAALNPRNKALVSSGKTLTYEELLDYALSIGEILRDEGVVPNQLVAVVMEKGWEQIAAVLGILQSGGAYLPIDPGFPDARRRLIVADGKVRHILTQSWLANALEWPDDVQILSVDTISGGGKKECKYIQQPHDLAYVIYTSGSTGTPKGVMIDHRGAVNTISDINKRFSVDQTDRILALSNLNFDLSVYDIFGTLAAGGTIVMPDHDKATDPAHWKALLLEHRVSIWNSVPALMQILVDDAFRRNIHFNDLRLALLSGDWISLKLPDQIRSIAKNSRVISLGGATEASIWSILYPIEEINPNWVSIPYGKAMTGQAFYVLDEALNQCRINVTGQLYIGGIGVAKGYWQDPEKTRSSFITHPESKKRLYRTGDMGAYMADGNIEFLGRKDFQVKIRGYRIELGEIENNINTHPHVAASVVKVFEDKNFSRKIAAYVMPLPPLKRSLDGHGQFYENHIGQWKEVYEHTYGESREGRNLTFNTSGWTSSYTGMPISQPEMAEWLKNTVDAIKSLHPECVLEIGCGTGMILSEIAPFCKHYTATDFSEHALEHVRAIVGASEALSNVELFKKTADDFSDFSHRLFDTLIINSVVQYFPDLHYLEKVIKNALGLVKPGGHIFIGDIRNYDLLNLFHTSVQLYKAPDNLSISQLKNRISYSQTREIELTVSPLFFMKLQRNITEISSVSISPKKGKYDNELNDYRYDVVLTINGRPAEFGMTDIYWQDSATQLFGLKDIERILRDNQLRTVGIRNVVHKRIEKQLKSAALIENCDFDCTVKDFKEELTGISLLGIEPHRLNGMADALGFTACMGLKNSDNRGRFDIVFVPESEKNKVFPYGFFMGHIEEEALEDANDPMHGRFMRELVPGLKTYLKERLPDYMQPTLFMVLENLRLNANGKIDRNQLPAPWQMEEGSHSHVPPNNERERALVRIWRQLLNTEETGIDDDFFSQGGDSLLAIQFISAVNAEFRTGLALQDLLSAPTIRQLAAKTRGKTETQALDELPRIQPSIADRYLPFALTDIQHAYWAGRNPAFELGNISTHIYFEIENTALDIERLNRTWQQLIERHDMLKTIITPDGKQKTIEQVPFYKFRVSDMRPYNEEAAREMLEKVRKEMFDFFPDSDRWPLFDIRVSIHGNARVRIHMVFEVMVIDAWSLFILMKEWRSLYSAPNERLPELELTFRDCVDAADRLKQSSLYVKAKKYWLEKLHTLPACPELPLAASPSTIDKPKFTRTAFTVSPAHWEALKSRGAKRKITPSVLLLSAYSEILNKWSRKSRFTINITLFNRPPFHPRVNDVVGDFTSLTLLAVDHTESISFEDKTLKLQKQLWQDMDNRHFSGVEVIREIAGKQGGPQQALMPVVFTSLNPDSFGKDFPGLNEMGELVYTITQTSQVWIDHQVMENPHGSLSLSWDSVEGLFPEGMIEDMFSSYCRLLEQLAWDEKIWGSSFLELMPRRQFQERHLFNRTAHPLSREMLHTPFIERALADGDKIAVVASGYKMSYGELLGFSHAMAKMLIGHGAERNRLVAVVMEKGWEQVAGVLSILMAGSAYLPIDPETPLLRLAHILETAGVKVVLTQSGLKKRIKWPGKVRVLSMDTVVPELPGENPPSVQTPRDLAYVIYTSGSTGLPKGVAIDHKGAANTIMDINQRFHVNSRDRVLALSALNFDLSVYDIFGTLAAGGSIVIPDPASANDPAHWSDLIKTEHVTIWNSVPQLMQMLVDHVSGRGEEMAQSLRLVLMSGDWIPLDLPLKIKSVFHQTEIVSLGGATEASIWSILYPIKEMDSSWKSIPYGSPMANQKFYVLNEKMEDCPDWVTGQLYIGGAGLAKGYWNDDEKTRNAFVSHPSTGETLYKTGDMGRFLPDGYIEFQGRKDFQVKINGYRIELGEIESCLRLCSGVSDAVVLVRGESHEDKRLVGYVVPEKHRQLSSTDLRQSLQERLPRYMVPPLYVMLDAFPMTANGKVDRKGLPEPEGVRPDETHDFIAPQNDLERIIADIVGKIIALEKVGTRDNLFDLGANSMHLVRIQNQLREALNRKVTMVDLFAHPSVHAMAAFFSQKEDASFGSEDLADKRAESRKKTRRRRLRHTVS